jgi:hypothetical protein
VAVPASTTSADDGCNPNVCTSRLLPTLNVVVQLVVVDGGIRSRARSSMWDEESKAWMDRTQGATIRVSLPVPAPSSTTSTSGWKTSSSRIDLSMLPA